MRQSMTFKEANSRLSHLPCSVPDCPSNRLGVSQYCAIHARRKAVYGHPLGYKIPRIFYEAELKEVRQLFDTSPDHPALVSLCKWIDGWIEEAHRGEAITGNKLLGRIHLKRFLGEEGLKAIDILTEVMAVWLYARRNPSRLPDDARLSVAIARNVLRLATFEKRGPNKGTRYPPLTELRGTGERFRQTLAPFLINVELSIVRQSEKAKEFRTNLSLPFIE